MCSLTGMPNELCPQGKLWHVYQLSSFDLLPQFVVLCMLTLTHTEFLTALLSTFLLHFYLHYSLLHSKDLFTSVLEAVFVLVIIT